MPKINIDNTILFCNPANFSSNIQIKQVKYYHKFSEKRIKNLPNYYRPNLQIFKTKLFLNKIYNYSRTNKSHLEIKPGIFFENIGKRIFEHLLHNRIVNYKTDDLKKPDGLFYYLKLLNGDGLKKHQPLKISVQIIKEKLFMNKDDKLLNLI